MQTNTIPTSSLLNDRSQRIAHLRKGLLKRLEPLELLGTGRERDMDDIVHGRNITTRPSYMNIHI